MRNIFFKQKLNGIVYKNKYLTKEINLHITENE